MSEVTESETGLPPLAWDDTPANHEALAKGQLSSSEVDAWRACAQRVEHAHGKGHVVLHHWVPAVRNAQPPVVLFHGGSGSWTHWVRSIGPLLQAGHDVWGVDLPGFGESDGFAGVIDADGMVDGLAQMLESIFPLQPVQLVGFSFGGMTAGLLAAAHPHVVHQLVIVGAPGFGLSAKHPFKLKGWRHLDSAYEQLQHHVYNLGELMLKDRRRIDRNTVALHVANVQADRLPRRRISSTDVLVQAMKQAQCPVHAIYGEADALYPQLLDTVEALLRSSAQHFAGMHRIAGAGHWVQYEAPQAVHACLLPILEGRAAGV